MARVYPILAIIGSALLTPAAGQVLTVPDVLSIQGDTFLIHGVANEELITPGLSGQGITWDFAQLQILTDSYTRYVTIEPASAPSFDEFPTSDLVLERSISFDPDDRTYEYFDRREEGLFQLASVGEVLTYEFDGPELVHSLPLFFDLAVEADYCYYSTGLGTTYHTCGETREVLDATGTLIMPYATLPNVLRTTYERYHVLDNSPDDTSYATLHRWWSPGVRRPVLERYSFTGTNGVTLISVTALGAGSFLGVDEPIASQPRLFPVPCRDRITIDLSGPLRADGKAIVRSADGRAVRIIGLPAGTSRTELDLSGLAAGHLSIEMYTDNGHTAHRLVRQP